ncbi:MAG: aldo/keto reductase [Mycoplasmoidaceae bacterium]|nr:MAG: aldo/keto reductase [Mycoplasmoidaceae bacterium]
MDIKLNNKVKIPQIGYGVYKMLDNKTTVDSIVCAIKSGYRLIDTASRYQNESCVGEAIKKCGLKREEIFITSKLWNDDQGYESTLKAFNQTMKKLGIKYLDLYLIHWPVPDGHEKDFLKLNLQTWKAMEELYKAKKIRAIGVSNFGISHLQNIIKNSKIIPMVNQIEFHPGAYDSKLINFCKKNKIVVEAWGPLGQGRAFSDPTLLSLAKKYNKTVSQICLRWCVQHNVVPLPKSSHEERIKQNFDIFNFKISTADMKILDNNENFQDTVGSNYYNRIH